MVAFISFNAQAKTMDEVLQKRVIDAAYAKCNLQRALSVKIENVEVVREKIEHGSYDYYFTATLIAAVENVNESAVNNKTIIVKAAEYDISNPTVDKYEILSVKSPGSDLCD